MQRSRLSMILQSRAWAWAVCAGLAGGTFLLLMARGVIAHVPHYDELYHVLAARGILETGEPVIATGYYERAELFTQAVAWSYLLFGDSLVSARLPALAAGVVLMFVVGGWLVRRAGLMAGATAVLLLCLAPTTVDLSVFARFYTWHAVAISLMYIAMFEAASPGRSRSARAALVASAAGLVAVGWHLQMTTAIAFLAGIAGTLAVLVTDHWIKLRPALARHWLLFSVGLACLFGAGLLVAYQTDLIGDFQRTSVWAAGNAGRLQYYLVEFRRELPLLWPLLPAAAVIAISDPTHRRLALFCVVTFASALAIHAVAPMKSTRYVYYLMPIACGVWGIALSVATARASEAASRRGPNALRHGAFTVLALAGFALLLSQEGARALNLALGRLGSIEKVPFAGEPDWRPLLGELAPRARQADRVVTSNAMKALYYLGRYDYELNVSIVPETEGHTEFGRDRRTGGRAIGQAASVAEVLEQPGTTLIVIESVKIGLPTGVRSDAFAVIQARCREVALPAGYGVRAWDCAPRS